MNRKKRYRYRQYDYNLKEIEKYNTEWKFEKYGCGPTSIANILVNFGYDYDHISIVKKILFKQDGCFNKTYLRNRGIAPEGLIYCLERLINEDKLNILYEIVKIDFSNPNKSKEKVYEMFKKGYMAIIHTGPSEISPLSFSKNGHYLVISDIDENNNFYVINSNKIGDKQVDTNFDYETIIKNIYGRKDSFNFLFIKKK